MSFSRCSVFAAQSVLSGVEYLKVFFDMLPKLLAARVVLIVHDSLAVGYENAMTWSTPAIRPTDNTHPNA